MSWARRARGRPLLLPRPVYGSSFDPVKLILTLRFPVPQIRSAEESAADGSDSDEDFGSDCESGVSQSASCSQDTDVARTYIDIGCTSMSAEEIDIKVKSLSREQKYKLLVNHFVPGTNFRFPKVFSAGCKRSFLFRWLDKYPWLVY